MNRIEPDQPLEHPAVWYGQQLWERPHTLGTLGDEEIGELAAAVKEAGRRGWSFDQITPATFCLPVLGPRLGQIQHALEHGAGAAVLRGLPTAQFNEDQCRYLFWGLAQYLGTPVSQSAQGERIFSVRDAGYGTEDPRARGPNTRKRLSFHTDRCDVIGFLCLQPAQSGGDNAMVSSMALYNEILRQHPDLLQVLMQPFYYHRHNVDTGNQRPYCRQPVFSIYQGHFAANLLRVLIERAHALPELPDLTDQQREALDYVEQLADSPHMHVRFRQERGDMLLLNNWVTLHRRTEFTDHPQPSKRRHVLRIWLSVPNSRPLHPDFAAHYGSTAPGALRGGMQPAQ